MFVRNSAIALVSGLLVTATAANAQARGRSLARPEAPHGLTARPGEDVRVKGVEKDVNVKGVNASHGTPGTQSSAVREVNDKALQRETVEHLEKNVKTEVSAEDAKLDAELNSKYEDLLDLGSPSKPAAAEQFGGLINEAKTEWGRAGKEGLNRLMDKALERVKQENGLMGTEAFLKTIEAEGIAEPAKKECPYIRGMIAA